MARRWDGKRILIYSAIGTTFGEGDGTSTFNLPDLIGRFAEGSGTPGTVKEAGLPNITGNVVMHLDTASSVTGAFAGSPAVSAQVPGSSQVTNGRSPIKLDASLSNPIYGASDTVQPPALTLLPCIKAFDATVNTGLINITELAQEVAGKTGSIAAAHAAMPSGQYIDLTLPASGGTVTAPADGYFRAKITGSNTGYFSADTYCDGIYIASHISIYAFGAFFLFFPVAAGDSAIIYNTTNTTSEYFSFVYANGSQPQ